MGFIDDIKNTLTEDLSFGKEFRCTLTANAGYFENVSHIVSYSEDQIVLAFKGAVVTVSGRNLYIKKYCEGDAAICGKIIGLKRE